jgi:tetratricopeptide (TPR) repeat protein
MSNDVERPTRRRPVAKLVILLLSASLAQFATAAAPTTQSATVTLTDGRTTVTLSKSPGFTESKASSPTQRVLETNDSSTRLTILPADQPTDPASAAAFVENNKLSLTAARRADLLSAPAAEQVENFALVMHYRVRRAPEQIVDTTVQWRRVGPVMVQAVSEVRSESATTIDAAKNAVAEMLNRAYVEGYQEPTAKNPSPTAAGADANAAAGASVDAGPNVQRFAGDTVEFTAPPMFEQIGTAKSDTSRDYLSSDHNTELIVTLMPPGTILDASSGPIQLTATKSDLQSPSAANKPTTAPVLLKNTALPVEIQWSFDRDGKPATGFRMFRKIHPKQVVSCEITTTDASSKAQQLGEATLNSMKSLLPPDPPPVTKAHIGGPNEEKRNQRAQAALDQAKKLADAKKDDEAYAKYKYIVTEYPDSPSATEAKTAMDKYEADPAFAERHKKPSEASPADKAAAMLALADNYSYVGRQDEARAKYQQVIKEYPDTPAAEKAKKRLSDMGKH